MKLSFLSIWVLASTIGVAGIKARIGIFSQKIHPEASRHAEANLEAGAHQQAPSAEFIDKSSLPFSVEIKNLAGAMGPVAVEVVPGSESGVDVASPHVTPTKACLRGKPTSTCFEAVADRNFGRPATAEVLDLGDGSTGLLLIATVNGVSGSMRMVAMLGLDEHGRLVNLLPFVYVTEVDGFRYWRGVGSAGYGVLTAGNTVWDMDHETRFDRHRYQISSYRYCPSSRRFALVDRFKTRRKYPMEPEGGDPGGQVLKAMMPQVKARLKGRLESCR